MPTPSAEALRLGERYRLGLRHRMRGGPAGERLGAGTGASIEFQDRRAYQPGDDVRHVDWRALARTDQLFVRQYHEEVLPRLDLLLDTSRSMAIEETKLRAALDVSAVLEEAARGEGFSVVTVLLGDAPERLGGERLVERDVAFEGRRPVDEVLREGALWLRPGSLRVVVSDFLTPAGASPIVTTVGRGAGGWALVQVLGARDVDPPREVAHRLVDPERDEALELEVGSDVRERYLERLRRLVAGLREACHARGGRHVELVADRPLEELCRDRLLPEGVLVPA